MRRHLQGLSRKHACSYLRLQGALTLHQGECQHSVTLNFVKVKINNAKWSCKRLLSSHQPLYEFLVVSECGNSCSCLGSSSNHAVSSLPMTREKKIFCRINLARGIFRPVQQSPNALSSTSTDATTSIVSVNLGNAWTHRALPQ